MSTGNFTDWTGNMLDIGPLYPFVGSEVLMVIIGFIFVIGWFILQARVESREIGEDLRLANGKLGVTGGAVHGAAD
ncbi:MAG: hypothetical protein K0S81_1872 [Rhodospirillales bacterium]|jgi:hypothetical protein|nr:hypothetical protein [Rhodospirillales bacterium]